MWLKKKAAPSQDTTWEQEVMVFWLWCLLRHTGWVTRGRIEYAGKVTNGSDSNVSTHQVSLFFSFASLSYFSKVLLSTMPVRYLLECEDNVSIHDARTLIFNSQTVN